MSFLSQQKNENKNKAEEKMKKKREAGENVWGWWKHSLFFFFSNIHSSDTVYGFLTGYAHGETYQNG